MAKAGLLLKPSTSMHQLAINLQAWQKRFLLLKLSISTHVGSYTVIELWHHRPVIELWHHRPSSAPAANFNHWHLNNNMHAPPVSISASCLFFAAIPTLIAFKKAAESLANLLDVTREELPGTMAAVRLSGMEISDLTMELNDLGQEITEGVRRSTRAVRAAEDGLRHMTSMASVGSSESPGRHHETGNSKIS